MPAELLAERGVVVGLDALNAEGQKLADFLEKFTGGPGIVVIVDAQNAKGRSLVNSRQPVIRWRARPIRRETYIELCGPHWNFQRAFRSGTRICVRIVDGLTYLVRCLPCFSFSNSMHSGVLAKTWRRNKIPKSNQKYAFNTKSW